MSVDQGKAASVEVGDSIPGSLVDKKEARYAKIDQDHTIPESGQRKTTTRWEYWSFCLYNWGGTGVGVGNYAGALQQSLVEAAFPSGFMPWGGQNTSTNTFILDMNGIIFAVQVVILLITAPYADYGNWRPWILIVWTIVGLASSFAFLGITDASQWALASGFYVLGNVALNITGAFYIAAFPIIVRDLPKLQESERAVIANEKTASEHAELVTMERSTLSDWSFIFSGLGSTLSIILSLAIAYGIGHTTDAQNNKVFAVTVGYFGALWLLTALPWFISDQHRPGQKLPVNTGWLTVGPKQVWQAAKNISRLKHTFIYIAAYFLISDANSTAGSIVQILQNNAIKFDTVTYSGLYAVVYGAAGIGILLQLWVQRIWNLTPRTMFIYNSLVAVPISLWGMIGIWTNVIGYHHVWEFWLFQAFLGFVSAGSGAYSATLMAELSPAPKMYIFFALFNTVGRTSSFVGPFISGAIINAAGGNNNVGFYFTFATGLVGTLLLFVVDVDKAKADIAQYLESEREELYAP